MTRFTLLIIVLLAYAIRLNYLSGPVRFDEAYTFHYFTAPLTTLVNYAHENNHILHTYLLTGIHRVSENHYFLLRLPAFYVGLLIVPVSYQVARRLYEVRTALFTAALCAASLPLVLFSANARGYTLLILVQLLLFLQALRALEKNRHVDWIVLSLLLATSLTIVPLMFYPAAMVLVWALLTSVIERKRTVGSWVVSTGAGLLMAALFYAPVHFTGGWVVFFENHLPGTLLDAPQLHLESQFLVREINSYLNTGLPLGVIAILLAGVGVFLHERVSQYMLPPALAAAGVVAMLVIGLRVVPEGRYWIGLLPFYYMSIAAGLVALTDIKAVQHHRPVAIILCCVIAYWLIFTNALNRSEETGVVPDGQDIAADLATILEPGDQLLMLDPHSEIIRYYLKNTELGFDPVVNPQRAPYALGLDSPGRIFTLYEADWQYGRATDYIHFNASNLSIDVQTVQMFGQDVLQEVIVESTTPVTSDTRMALFSDDFTDGDLEDDWIFDPDVTAIQTIGNNRVLEVNSGEEWAFVTLREGSLWIDYSVFARVRVLQAGDNKDDVFVNVRYLPPIGNYSGSINPSYDIAMISADLDRDWRGPLVPVGVRTMPNAGWQQMHIRSAGNSIELNVNGEQVALARDNTIQRGSIRIVVPPYHRVQIDDIVVIEEVDTALDLVMDDPLDDMHHWSFESWHARGQGGVMQIGSETDWSFVQLADERVFEDMAIDARLRVKTPHPDLNDLMVLFRQGGAGNYAATFDVESGTLAIGEDRYGTWQGELAQGQFKFEPDVWYDVRIQAIDDSLAVLVNDLQLARTLDNRYSAGWFTLAVPPGGLVEIDHIQIHSRDGES